MSLEEKLVELGIKRILVADDRIEHLLTASGYLAKIRGVEIETAKSAEEAKKMIVERYAAGKKYDLVLSDLSMEKEESGFEVVREGLKHFAYSFIVTGRQGGGNHGPTTTMLPQEKMISGLKDREATWQFALESALEYLQEHSQLCSSLKRYETFVGKLFEGKALDLMMELYR